MQKLITLTLFLLFSSTALAQYPGAGGPPKIGVVQGSVVDQQTNEPIAYATITIKSAKDSTVITGALSQEDGSFMVNEIPLGGHFAEISFIGYEKQVRGPLVFNPQETVKHDLGPIVLSASATAIESVTVEGAAAPVRYEVDKKIYDASQIRAAEGGNAKDVLQQIPSVTVDDQGNIQLRGSQNVRVLINGRPSSFSLQTLLEQIPQKNIQDIEVITNPSAKYDAEGEAGIINIVLKENNIEGFTGNLGYNWGTENKYNGNVGLNLKTKKWNLSSSFNLNRFEDDFLRDNLRVDVANPFSQITDEDRDFVRRGEFARIGVDHYLNSSSTIFLSASLNPGDGDNTSITANDEVFYNTPNDPEDIFTDYNRFNTGFNDRKGYEVTLGLQKEFNENPRHNLLFDVAYNVGEEETTNQRRNVFFNPNELIYNSRDTDITDNDRNTTTVSLDYTNPFDGKQKLEVGFRAVLEDQEQRFQVFDETLLSSDDLFNFTQDVAASYITYEYNIDKLGLKGGLRSEFTNVDSRVENELSNENEYTDSYISLFPTATASYTLSESANMKLGYSRRINRPNGRQLTPFADRSDLNNLFEGNNTLRPEFTDSYELGYSKFFEKFSIDASLYHRGVNDHIRYFRDANANGTSSITFQNIDKLNVYGLESSFNASPAKWLNLTLSGNYNYGEIKNPENQSGEVLNASTSIFSGNFMANLNLPKGWGGQVATNYQSPFAYYQGRLSSMWGANVNVRKSFMKGKMNTYIRVNDLFNTFGLNIDFEDDVQSQSLELDWPSQMGFIGFNYNFGQMKSPAKRKQQRREERGEQQPGLGF